MVRSPFVPALLVLGAALSGAAPGFDLVAAHAQQSPALRPRVKGRAHRLKIDSSPQQGTVYWDSGPAPNPKGFGVAGYTPITLKVPRGPVKIIVEIAGFKPQEQMIDVRRSQTVMFTRVVFFGALPMVFAGLRIALAVSFIVLVAAEFVASKTGIGYLIWNSWELLQVDVTFVGIATIGVLGLITSALFQEVERRIIPWKDAR